MANGFVTERPSERHGTSQAGGAAGYVWCQKFTAPGSGDLDITEIGCWVQDNNEQFRMAIFTDDAANNCPDTMVANSESDTLTSGSTMAIRYHTYSTKPRLTGGTAYWLCAYEGAGLNFSYVSGASVTGINVNGYTSLYTWPSGDNWHTHTDRNTADFSFYAVYTTTTTTTTTTTAVGVLIETFYFGIANP